MPSLKQLSLRSDGFFFFHFIIYLTPNRPPSLDSIDCNVVLRQNKIANLPENIGVMTGLELLSLSSNLLIALPIAICDMTRFVSTVETTMEATMEIV